MDLIQLIRQVKADQETDQVQIDKGQMVTTQVVTAVPVNLTTQVLLVRVTTLQMA